MKKDEVVYVRLSLSRNAEKLKQIKESWEKKDEQTWQYQGNDPRYLGSRLRRYWITWLLEKQIARTKPVYFLDVGCAEGLFVHETSHYRVFSVGLDISSEMLKKANRNALGSVSLHEFTDFCVGDISHLPFRDQSCSIVLCSETLEHTLDWKLCLKHLGRIAQNLVISYPSYESPLSLLLMKMMKVVADKDIFKESPEGHISFIRRRELEKALMGMGLNLRERISSHAVFSFPTVQFGTNIVSIIYHINPDFASRVSQVMEKLDKKLDHRLSTFLLPFAGSVIELWTTDTPK